MMIDTREQPGTVSHSDAGATFIELLVSVVLLGITGVAVLAATSAAIVGARTSDNIAVTQRSVSEAADFLTDTDSAPGKVPYQACDTPGVTAAYQGALDAQFGVDAVVVTEVRFWNRSTGTFGATCRAAQGDRLQEVELRSTFDGSERSIAVVKRPTAPPTLDTVPAPPLPPFAGGSGQAVVSLTPGL